MKSVINTARKGATGMEKKKAESAPFTRQDFHALIKKAATTPVEEPDPKAK